MAEKQGCLNLVFNKAVDAVVGSLVSFVIAYVFRAPPVGIYQSNGTPERLNLSMAQCVSRGSPLALLDIDADCRRSWLLRPNGHLGNHAEIASDNIS
ncbi:MAG: hypothetical protein ABSB42_07855 [Tepidisphaeraceae bacterium]|jgi:hypothetical protein